MKYLSSGFLLELATASYWVIDGARVHVCTRACVCVHVPTLRNKSYYYYHHLMWDNTW